MKLVKLWEYLGDNPSLEVINEVELWSAESPQNSKLLEELYYLNQLSKSSQILTDSNSKAAYLKVRKRLKSNKRKSIKYWIYHPIAALLVGAVFISVLFLLNSLSVQEHRFYTEAGDRVQLVLPDESRIWLNSSSELWYTTSLFGFNRQVNLEGEAYFEVAKRKYNQFKVCTDEVMTKVLGTSFNLRSRKEENRVVTTLLEGSVEVDMCHAHQSVLLKPGQTLCIDTSNQNYTLTNEEFPDDYILWIKGKMNFKQAPLHYILDTFQKHYNVKFIFKEDTLRNIRFTCEFSTEDEIEQLLNVLSLTKKIQFAKETNNTYQVKPI